MPIRPLSPELQEKAVAELNEVPSRLRDDLDHIKEWICQQPHLNARSDDQWLLSFLRPCKFSLQKTKEKLEFYYTLRTIFPYYFQNRNPFSYDVQMFCKLSAFVVLPQGSNPLAPRRSFIISRYGDPDKSSLKEGLRVLLMIADMYMYEQDPGVINGQELIIDMKGVSSQYHQQCTLSLIKTAAMFLQNAYPARVQGVHLINVPLFVHTIIKIVKTLISKKIFDRIHIYLENDFDSLYKAIPRDIFPEEYGGNAGTLWKLADELRVKLESYHKWFQEDAQYCTDELKRPGKPRTSEELFGVEGTFRKLEID